MRISIWREFTSNNSARFTVVGVFESADKAQVAADRLMRLVRDIVQWLRQPENTPPGQDWVDAGDGPPSPAELRAAQEYGIDWGDQSVDWVWMDEAGNGPVRVLDNIVFIDGTESWLGSHPADYLIEKLGGRVLVDGDIEVDELGEPSLSARVLLHLSCLAPDEATAEAMEAEINRYLRANANPGPTMFHTPWRDLGGRWGPSSYSGSLHRQGRRLVFEQGQFFHIADGFPAMLAYLRDRGCADIQYAFTEVRRGEDEED